VLVVEVEVVLVWVRERTLGLGLHEGREFDLEEACPRQESDWFRLGRSGLGSHQELPRGWLLRTD
jgi:hypothetical protein